VLAVHGNICTAVSFSDNNIDFWNGGFRESIKKLCTVSYYSAVLLAYSGQIPRYIGKGYNWNVERITETNNLAALSEEFTSKTPAATFG